MTEEEWDAVIKVHLKGTFGPARWAAAYWREQVKAGKTVDGRIINTTSVSGIYGNPGQTNYGAAKAGIAAFTIIAALELARYGVTVNAVAPGRAHPHDRGPRAGAGDRRGARACARPAGSPRSSRGSPRPSRRASPAGCSRRRATVLAIAEGWHRGPAHRAGRRPDQARPDRRRPAGQGPRATPAWTARRAPGRRSSTDAVARRYRRPEREPPCPSTLMPSAHESEPVATSLDLEGRPALRRRHRCRHRRAGLHDREHRRRRPAGVPHVRRGARLGGGGAMRRHRHLQPGDARARRAAGDAAQADPARGLGHGDGQASSASTTRARPPSWSPRPTAIDAPTATPLYTTYIVGVHPRRGRLGRRPWAPAAPATCRRSGPPTTRSPTRPRPTRPSSTGSPATATRSTPTRRSPRMGGFDRPILHGLCTLRLHRPGAAPHAVRHDPARFQHIEGRFSSPVLPGRRPHHLDVGHRRRRGRLHDGQAGRHGRHRPGPGPLQLIAAWRHPSAFRTLSSLRRTRRLYPVASEQAELVGRGRGARRSRPRPTPARGPRPAPGPAASPPGRRTCRRTGRSVPSRSSRST